MKYRDRAKERREGNPFELEQPIGLDFELLRKTRNNIELQVEQSRDEEQVQTYVDSLDITNTVVQCSSADAQTIYKLAFDLGTRKQTIAPIQIDRMAYLWDIDGPDEPTIIMHSNPDAKHAQYCIGREAVTQKIIEWFESRSSAPCVETVETVEPVEPVDTVEDMLDIFSDAGSEYELDVDPDKLKLPIEDDEQKGDKTDILNANDDKEKIGISAILKGVEDKIDTLDEASKLQGFTPHEPTDNSMQLYGSDDGDSDDSVVDLEQVDMGVSQNKKRQLTRFDFDTQEEWIAYKSNQVHMPKAAFQFGIKASDGRTRHLGGKKASKGNKFNREFQQLESVYRKRYGSELRVEQEESHGDATKKARRK